MRINILYCQFKFLIEYFFTDKNACSSNLSRYLACGLIIIDASGLTMNLGCVGRSPTLWSMIYVQTDRGGLKSRLKVPTKERSAISFCVFLIPWHWSSFLLSVVVGYYGKKPPCLEAARDQQVESYVLMRKHVSCECFIGVVIQIRRSISIFRQLFVKINMSNNNKMSS